MDAPPSTFPPVALCLGGLDPSGGAGLLRDAATLSELGVHVMVVCTAETVQNGLACTRVEAPSIDPLVRLESVQGHLSGNWGLKLGMCVLPLPAWKGLASKIADLAPPIRIWDPILAPTSGPGLHDRASLLSMAEVLLAGGGWVVAPNRPEAAVAAALDPGADPLALAGPFLDRGARAVWLKGGHAPGEDIQDLWVTAEGCAGLQPSPRLPGVRRGTGCTLASAWLGFRLSGVDELSAANQAAGWLRSRWGAAFAPGGFGRPLFPPRGPR
jgi:hydroxymethylpyrimidine/phosphomethylpyrimidine kinase